MNKTISFLTAMISVIFFSLVSVTGALAWFTSQRIANNEASGFAVFATSSEIMDVSLIKFDYAVLANIGERGEAKYDYLNPGKGAVNRYAFNSEENRFGYYEDDSFVAVEFMNLYDPLELLISGGRLADMNTNVILEVRLRSNITSNADLILSATRFALEGLEDDALLSSDCMDFDLFLKDDIDDESFPDKSYYPDYISQSKELNEVEKIYYRSASASHSKAGHSNFYETDPKPETLTIDSVTPEFEDGVVTAYININYAPSELKQYETSIRTTSMTVFYDYCFSFDVKQKVVEP